MIETGKGAAAPRSALLDVLTRKSALRRPMWFMRQAGRYLPEYRAVREKAGSFLDLCYNPELAAEVTVQPLRRYDLDAAILFADILVVPHAMGLPLKFAEGEGPVLGTVRSMEDLDRLRPVAATYEVKQVCRTVGLTRSQLAPHQALIGFCGAPWTVASYMVGGGSSDRVMAKVAAYQRQPWFCALIDRLVRESVDYLLAQAKAGAQAVQIFDSWAGDLVGTELEEFVIKPLAAIVAGVKAQLPALPIIVFARGVGMAQRKAAAIPGANAIGVETEFDLADLPQDVVVQGNLDPVALLAGPDVVTREVRRICTSLDRQRHIFNLGHGIRLGTDPSVVGAVVNAVRLYDE
ncbi:uroporphyrinogen decarboxylase [Aestuariivirga sp.]|uniref:uroporphyrinogen decarboxylase n=1 Tax=Aestuariivirga sp. TaxID=2650926 RepID=UPI0025C487E5|nr:uroporphyrinogen decarboxylase [Aestuariivirga sp.]MCA3554313.1 uroporphyrinogen decarboxylase [Aestuariivirga sp.]